MFKVIIVLEMYVHHILYIMLSIATVCVEVSIHHKSFCVYVCSLLSLIGLLMSFFYSSNEISIAVGVNKSSGTSRHLRLNIFMHAERSS